MTMIKHNGTKIEFYQPNQLRRKVEHTKESVRKN